MKIHRNIAAFPAFKKSVITIGTFDGVHIGHARIMQQVVQTARQIDGTSVIITFYPHPRNVISKDSPIGILTTQEEKYAKLEKLGVDHLIEIPFNKTFAEQSAEDYITHFLVKYFNPHTIITGYDHKFGKNRSGDYKLLELFGEKHQFEVKEIPAEVLEQVAISSTRIRTALQTGDVEKATELLGYPYTLSGEVIQGAQRGRTINFPTANISPIEPEKLIPGYGVYAVKVLVDEKQYWGMMNIGNRPTVSGTHRTIEVHILDFNEDIYGKKITLSFEKRLRDEKKFENLEALKMQLESDRKQVQSIARNLA